MPAKAAAKPAAKKKPDPKSNKAGGAKSKKKKWTKVLWTPKTIQKLENDVPKYRVITVHVISNRLEVNGSLAREGIQHLLQKKLIREVVKGVYTRRIAAEE